MAEQPYVFEAGVESLISAISEERFKTYRAVTASDVEAFRLYTWNSCASAALYAPLQTLEVTLRNSVHSGLVAGHGVHWYDDVNVLRHAEQSDVQKATNTLLDLGKPPTPGRVVAELSFGFWVALFANKYDTTLWRTDLFRLFAPQIKQRTTVHNALDRLRTLRNRVAHHEPIFQRKLADDFVRVRTLVGCLSPQTLKWLDHHETITKVLETSPADLLSF